MPIRNFYTGVYSKLKLSYEQLDNSIKLQVLAYQNPKRINWPAEPWTPTNQLDRILKAIKDSKGVIKTNG